jgi:sterol 3beta-glucosyltransferase
VHLRIWDEMRVAIASLGSRGDFQPMAALAVTLSRRGHDIRLITHQGCAGVVNEPGIDLRLIDCDMRAELSTVEGRQFLHSGRDVVARLRALRAIARRNLRVIWSGLAEHSQDTELLVCEWPSLTLMEAIAERRGLRCIPVFFQPRIPVFFQSRAGTTSFPYPSLPGWVNRLHHHLSDQVLWQAVRSLVNDGRRETLGLPPWPLFGPFARFRREAHPVLLAFSRHILPRPADWHAGIEVTGYWFLDKPSAWQPPTELVEFLQAGPPPIYVGFGSMTLVDQTATTALVLGAIAEAGCRAVIAAGWGGLGPNLSLPNIFTLEEAPHDWLFPRMAAVVHHGGAGTTAAALRAGVPSVLVPFVDDQFSWSRILALKGVAPEPVPQARLSVSGLGLAMRLALDDRAMRERAVALGALIQDEDGVAHAADRIEVIGTGAAFRDVG